MENPSFDEDLVPPTGSNCFDYKTTSSGSDPITDWQASGSVILIHQGCAAWGGLSSGDGRNYLGLQRRNAFVSQVVDSLQIGALYEISFLIAHRPDNHVDERFAVYIDSANVTQVGSDHPGECLWECAAPEVDDERVVTSNNFSRHVTRFTAVSNTHVLKFKNMSPSNQDRTIFIDDVQIRRSTHGVLNGGFEYDEDNGGATLQDLQDADSLSVPYFSYSPATRYKYDDRCYAASNFYAYVFSNENGALATPIFHSSPKFRRTLNGYTAHFQWRESSLKANPTHLPPPYGWTSQTDVQDLGNYV